MSPPKPLPTDTRAGPPGKKKIRIPMGQRKSGLAVPADKVDICKHMEIINRIKPTFARYVCGDCQEQIVLVPIQMRLMTEPEFDALQMAQVLQERAAQRKQKTGLVTPDQVRREGQKR